VEVIFGEDNPAEGYEVVTKPPLGKCSINIDQLLHDLELIFHHFLIVVRWNRCLRSLY
jgi:hypothetical protein